MYFLISLIFLHLGFAEAAESSSALFIVDKAKNVIHLADYQPNHRIEIKKTYHATLGKVLGDKKKEGDRKTPEGIYFFTAKLRPPKLKKKFGNLAYLMDYPNPVDKFQGRNGSDIMLHATDEPRRLKKNFDSLGCIVINNSQILELAAHVKMQVTPIVVYENFDDKFLKGDFPVKLEILKKFKTWLTGWNTKDIQKYIGAYDERFTHGKMNLEDYKSYKQGLNQRYEKIRVDASNVRVIFHPKYSVVMFRQKYESHFSNGRTAFSSLRTKKLYFTEQSGEYKILKETVTSQL